MSIATLLTLLTQSALADSFNMRLALSKSSPVPGDSLSLEVRLTNTSDRPVQIPADWTQHLQMVAWREEPGQRPQPRQIESTMDATLLQARQMKWMTVEAGQTLTHTLPLAIEACAAGCMGGDYYGQVSLGWNLVEGLKSNQETPKEAVSFDFKVKLPVEAVATGLTGRILSVSAPDEIGTVTGILAVHNDASTPIWVPRADLWGSGCEVQDKKGNSLGMVMPAGSDGMQTEEGYTLLAPASAMEVPFTCTSVVTGKVPSKATISVVLRPGPATFFPIQPQEQRAVFTGMVASAEPAPLPRK